MFQRRASRIGDGSWKNLSGLSVWMCTKRRFRLRWPKGANGAKLGSMARSPIGLRRPGAMTCHQFARMADLLQRLHVSEGISQGVPAEMPQS